MLESLFWVSLVTVMVILAYLANFLVRTQIQRREEQKKFQNWASRRGVVVTRASTKPPEK